MKDARVLLAGVLAVAAVLAFSAAIVALAPYIAAVIVVVGVVGGVLKMGKPPDIPKPIDDQSQKDL